MNAIEATKKMTANTRLQPEYDARIMNIAGNVEAAKKRTLMTRKLVLKWHIGLETFLLTQYWCLIYEIVALKFWSI